MDVLFKWHEKLLITRVPRNSVVAFESAKSIDSSNCAEIDLDCERENYCHNACSCVRCALTCVCDVVSLV